MLWNKVLKTYLQSYVHLSIRARHLKLPLDFLIGGNLQMLVSPRGGGGGLGAHLFTQSILLLKEFSDAPHPPYKYFLHFIDLVIKMKDQSFKTLLEKKSCKPCTIGPFRYTCTTLYAFKLRSHWRQMANITIGNLRWRICFTMTYAVSFASVFISITPSFTNTFSFAFINMEIKVVTVQLI